MITSAPDSGIPSGYSVRVRALHIFTLCAFAFTQPILAALSQQTVFLHDQEIDWPEISAVLVVLILGLPACCVLLDLITVRHARRLSNRAPNAMLFVLTSLVLLSLLRPCAKIPIVAMQNSIWFYSLSSALLGAWFFTYQYERLSWVRHWLTVSALGIAVFPISFVWQIEHTHQLKLDDDARKRTHVQNPVPVVMIVFDEFSGTSLMDERLQIDASSYPNFARLASQSTWYRQATTVHSRTDVAVPAILSGQFPVSRRGPVEANYPGNLLQTIHASGAYDMAVFEPVTRMCPESMSRERSAIPTSFIQRAANLIQTLAAVYPRLLLPSDTPISFPVIPKPWFGMRSAPQISKSSLTSGLFHYQYTLEREVQQDHFLDCLRKSDHPLFAFFHILLPHFPWEYFPSGRHYTDESYSPSSPESATGEIGETWTSDTAAVLRNEHRYLLQVGYTDRFIGRVLDRLEQTGLLDRCLLIVTADHGVSFRPSRSRRVPDAENIADILSVPLFVKLPGQTKGSIDDHNVESVDLYPTIAEELGIELSEPVDGSSLSSFETERPRKTLYFENDMTVVGPQVPQLEAAVQRRLKSFGDGPYKLPSQSTASRPDWHGKPLVDFLIAEDDAQDNTAVVMSSPASWADDDITTLLITGTVLHRSLSTPPELVLATGGIICDSCRASRTSYDSHSFSFLIPESMADAAPTEVELFLVKLDEANVAKLVRLRKWTLQPSK